MKKILYSALAIATAIGGVAATKANAHRVNNAYRLILTPLSVHDVTLTTNWTFTTGTPSCSAQVDPCQVISTEAVNTAIAGRKVPTLPTGTKINATTSLGKFVLQSNSSAHYTGTNKTIQ